MAKPERSASRFPQGSEFAVDFASQMVQFVAYTA
jgi:hypothetical protein